MLNAIAIAVIGAHVVPNSTGWWIAYAVAMSILLLIDAIIRAIQEGH